MIQFDILGIKEIEEKLSRMQIEMADIVIGDVQDYILNVMRSDQPTPKHVTRTAAYGFPFFTDKQRKWFFASLADGSIDVPYKRTQGLSNAWQIVDRGVSGYLVNKTKGANFVVGSMQSRHEKMVGWKTIMKQVEDRKDKIKRIIDGAAKKALRKLRLA